MVPSTHKTSERLPVSAAGLHGPQVPEGPPVLLVRQARWVQQALVRLVPPAARPKGSGSVIPKARKAFYPQGAQASKASKAGKV